MAQMGFRLLRWPNGAQDFSPALRLLGGETSGWKPATQQVWKPALQPNAQILPLQTRMKSLVSPPCRQPDLRPTRAGLSLADSRNGSDCSKVWWHFGR